MAIDIFGKYSINNIMKTIRNYVQITLHKYCRSDIFCQIVQKLCRHTVKGKEILVQYGKISDDLYAALT